MSQKREEEETLELKVSAPEAIAAALCPENCKISPPTTAASSSCAGSGAPEPIRPDPSKNAFPMATTPDEKEKDKDRSDRIDFEEASAPAASMKKAVNRCLCCGKRVGLTGFRCRCGELFCSVHRYSDRHDCSFDYKAAGREAIARENPVVRAAKILKV